ncbi:MAG: hypothetical protein B6D56_03515 [Candidatus Omnitrophica bacterium 4484_70.1]|nr:MAG: hypothetical protein B6D56_03515 [Candidatus Omnitrophica bacterium 4484_70.1]
MRALVTGGAGFIGSHIVERLLKDGHKVIVLDDLCSGKLENLSFISSELVEWGKEIRNLNSAKWNSGNFTFVYGDIRDYSVCEEVCSGVDVIFHQAALRSVPKSMMYPYEYNEVNINGTLNLLKAAKKWGVKRFIFASSSSIYGETDKFPENEEDFPRLISPYALTKLAGEYYCRIFAKNFGVETICLRYFNVYGERQSLDDEYAVVIPKFIYCMLKDENPPIHGNGKQSRDFTYVENVVEANLLASEVSFSKIQALENNVFNIANGSSYSILELVEYLNQIMGKSIEPVFTPPRPGDVFKTLADISKAKDVLGYRPKVDFKEGLKRAVEWFRKSSVS